MTTRTHHVAALLLVTVFLSGCTDKKTATLETDKFELLRADPLLQIDVPGGTPEADVTGNPGSGGSRGTSARAFRVWAIQDPSEANFAAVLERAVALGVRLDFLRCGTSLSARGPKPVGRYVAGASMNMDSGPPAKLQVMLTIAGGADAATLPLPPQNRFVDPTCPENLRRFIP